MYPEYCFIEDILEYINAELVGKSHYFSHCTVGVVTAVVARTFIRRRWLRGCHFIAKTVAPLWSSSSALSFAPIRRSLSSGKSGPLSVCDFVAAAGFVLLGIAFYFVLIEVAAIIISPSTATTHSHTCLPFDFIAASTFRLFLQF